MLCSASRDPRFESLSGKFNNDQFRKQYAFVYDESLPSEKQELKKQMQVCVPNSAPARSLATVLQTTLCHCGCLAPFTVARPYVLLVTTDSQAA